MRLPQSRCSFAMTGWGKARKIISVTLSERREREGLIKLHEIATVALLLRNDWLGEGPENNTRYPERAKGA